MSAGRPPGRDRNPSNAEPRPPRLALWLLRRVIPRGERDLILAELEDFHRRRGGGPAWFWWQAVAYLSRAPAFWGGAAGLHASVGHALRALRRRPLVPVLATLALALAVGANVAVFTVVDGVLLAPLPYPEPDRLVQIWLEDPERPGARPRVSPDAYRAWSGAALLDGWGLVSLPRATLLGFGDPRDVLLGQVSPELLRRLGADPLLGRQPTLRDVEAGEPVLLLAHGFWREALGGDPDVLGRSMRLGEDTYSVVGVARPGFRLPLDRDVIGWSALDRDDVSPFLADVPLYEMVGWAPATVSPRELEAWLAARLPESARRIGLRARVAPLEQVQRPADAALPVLLAAVWLVLVLSCVNVAQLLLARGLDRMPELGLRAALGAPPNVLRAMLLAEGIAIAGVAVCLGSALAVAFVDGLIALDPGHLPRWVDVRPTGRVALYVGGLALVATLLAAILPVARRSGRSFGELLRRRPGEGAPAALRTQRALLALQTALALVLLVGSGLLMRSWVAVQAVDLGFEADGLAVARVVLPPGRYAPGDGAAHVRFFEALRTALEARPEIGRAAVATGLPGVEGLDFEIAMEAEGGARTPAPIAIRTVSSAYAETLALRLLAGRTTGPGDDRDAEPVALLNRSAVRALFGAGDPAAAVGRNLIEGERRRLVRVVGVVEDVRELGAERPPPPLVLQPFLQSRPFGRMWIAVRPSRPGVDPWPAVRAALDQVDAELPLVDAGDLSTHLDAATAPRRLVLYLLSALGALAFVVAMVGVGGLSAFLAARQRRQVALRRALGAGPARALIPSLAAPLAGVGAGMVIGLVGVLLARDALAALLFGIQPLDAAAVGGALLILALASCASALVPGLVAARTQPRDVLDG